MTRRRQWGASFDSAWARVTRVAAFVGGMGIMAYETLSDTSDRPWLYAAAIGMMGLPVARVAENVLAKVGAAGPGTDDEPPKRRR